MFLYLFLVSVALGQDDRQHIALIDTGINPSRALKPYLCRDGHKDFTNTGLRDAEGHGTEMAQIIAEKINPKKSCIVNVKWVNDRKSKNRDDVPAIRYARHIHNVKLVNLSLSGTYYDEKEYNAIQTLLVRNISVIVAAGNDGVDLSVGCIAFPACYGFSLNPHRFFVVSTLHVYTNKNGPIHYIENGPYTSNAAARKTAKLAAELEDEI